MVEAGVEVEGDVVVEGIERLDVDCFKTPGAKTVRGKI